MEFIVAVFFLSKQENPYIIYDNLDLSYDIYNTINDYNQRQNHYLLLIQKIFGTILSDVKCSFMTSSTSSFIMISMLSLLDVLHALDHYL